MITVLQLLLFALLGLGLCWAFKRELGRELVWSIGGVGYYPGGLVVPAGYHKPTTPYLPRAANQPRGIWQVQGTTVATYDGLTFTLRRNNQDGTYTSVQFECYVNPTPAPSLPIIGIDLTGLTTATQIAAAFAAALATAGFSVLHFSPNDYFSVTQPAPGAQGNLGFLSDFDGGNLINIGATDGQATDVFAIYGQTVFFGAYELSLPIRVGKIYGAAPVASPNVSNTTN